MTTATGSAPRCKPLCCKIDHDADVLLRTMVPTGRGIGLLLSELIRKEARARAAAAVGAGPAGGTPGAAGRRGVGTQKAREQSAKHRSRATTRVRSRRQAP